MSPHPFFENANKVEVSKDLVRTIFLSHGFTIKEGQIDLKDYVYEAVDALVEEINANVCANSITIDRIQQAALQLGLLEKPGENIEYEEKLLKLVTLSSVGIHRRIPMKNEIIQSGSYCQDCGKLFEED